MRGIVLKSEKSKKSVSTMYPSASKDGKTQVDELAMIQPVDQLHLTHL
jgi:hypothetical protein